MFSFIEYIENLSPDNIVHPNLNVTIDKRESVTGVESKTSLSYISNCTFTHIVSSKLRIMQNRQQVKAALSNKTSEVMEKLAPSLPMLEAYFYVITFVGGVFFSLYCFYLAGQKELERLELNEVEPWWYV